MTRNSGRNTDGTFAKGNSGKPKGSRNRATVAVFSLLEGDAEAIARKAIELALDGDRTALRLCFERIAPPRRDVPVELDLGTIKNAKDAANASATVIAETTAGNMAPAEAAQIMAMITNYAQTLEISEFEQRLEALEAKNEKSE